MLSWFGSLLDRVCGITGAVVFSQAPLYVQQYTHQMAGHVAELQHQVAAMQAVAQQGGKSLDAFILKFVSSSDPDFRAQGTLMQGMVQRWHALSEGLLALKQAPVWERPFTFFRYLDTHVASDTFHTFSPGLPFTFEGLLYAIVGLLIGTALFRLLRGMVRGLISSLRSGREAAAS